MSHPRPAAATAACALALLLGLYLLPIGQRGLVGPDEPRYASIARQMADSGDWVTPVLWGEPWFEKPAMLYWLGGLGHAAGLEAFTRVPVALLCLCFLAFFYLRARKSFDCETAAVATGILATAGGWVAFADAGVFDAPLTVFLSSALLCILDWPRGERATRGGAMAGFGALLGLAALCKGLVAPVIAAAAVLPALAARPRRIAELLVPLPLAAFCLACLPWYAACYLENGTRFVSEFIIRHHFERFADSSLQHVQPWWFYLPVLAAFLLPWTPLLAALRWDSLAGGPRRRFLACWALGPLIFFSASVNKLPGYILPILPPLALLLALRWRRAPTRPLLAASAAALLLLPLAAALLPDALADGILRAWDRLEPGALAGSVTAGLLLGAAGIWSATRLPAGRAPVATAAVAAIALSTLKFQAFPAISAQSGTREFVEAERGHLLAACIGDVRRHAAYGIRFYTRNQVPDCERRPSPVRVEGDPPEIRQSMPPTGGGSGPEP